MREFSSGHRGLASSEPTGATSGGLAAPPELARGNIAVDVHREQSLYSDFGSRAPEFHGPATDVDALGANGAGS